MTSKTPSHNGADHGFGLAIVRIVATRRGGRVAYRNDHGAVFEAALPMLAAGAALGANHV